MEGARPSPQAEHSYLPGDGSHPPAVLSQLLSASRSSLRLSPFLLQNGFSVRIASSPSGCTLCCLTLGLLPSCLRFFLSLGLPPPDIPRCPGVTASPLSLYYRAGTGSLGTLGVTLLQTPRLSVAHPWLAMPSLSPGVPRASRLTA